MNLNKKNVFSLLTLMSVFFSFASAQQIEDFTMRFCADGSDVGVQATATESLVQITPGETKDVCLVVENKSDKDANIAFNYFDSTLVGGKQQVCEITTGFNKFFTSEDRTVLVKSGEVKKVIQKVTAPLGMNGMQYGCLAYQVEGAGNMQAMFKIVVRKPIFLNLFVGGSGDIKKGILFLDLSGNNMSNNTHGQMTFDAMGKLVARFLVKNNGNVSQDVVLSGLVYNFLGFQKEFSSSTAKIAPGKDLLIEIPVGMLPSYKGPFSWSVNLSATPVFDFGLQGVDENLLTPLSFVETGSFFLFSWIWVIAGGVLLLFLLPLIKLIKKSFSSKEITVSSSVSV